MEREDIRKKVDLAFLSAFYSGMLTENQRRILSLHCEEDLSLGEIAEEVGISRQAAHETLTRAASKLTEMESVLGVADRFRRMEVGLPVVIDDDHRVQQAGAHFPEPIAQQAVVGVLQPVRVAGDQLIRQIPGDFQ